MKDLFVANHNQISKVLEWNQIISENKLKCWLWDHILNLF